MPRRRSRKNTNSSAKNLNGGSKHSGENSSKGPKPPSSKRPSRDTDDPDRQTDQDSNEFSTNLSLDVISCTDLVYDDNLFGLHDHVPFSVKWQTREVLVKRPVKTPAPLIDLPPKQGEPLRLEDHDEPLTVYDPLTARERREATAVAVHLRKIPENTSGGRFSLEVPSTRQDGGRLETRWGETSQHLREGGQSISEPNLTTKKRIGCKLADHESSSESCDSSLHSDARTGARRGGPEKGKKNIKTVVRKHVSLPNTAIKSPHASFRVSRKVEKTSCPCKDKENPSFPTVFERSDTSKAKLDWLRRHDDALNATGTFSWLCDCKWEDKEKASRAINGVLIPCNSLQPSTHLSRGLYEVRSDKTAWPADHLIAKTRDFHPGKLIVAAADTASLELPGFRVTPENPLQCVRCKKPCLQVANHVYIWNEPCPQFTEVGTESVATFPAKLHITLKNLGSTMIRYRWFKNIHSDSFQTGRYLTSPFRFNGVDGTLLPGDSITLPIRFLADHPGCWCEGWNLITEPQLGPSGQQGIVVNLWGIALQADFNFFARAKLNEEIERRAMYKTIANELDSLIRYLPLPEEVPLVGDPRTRWDPENLLPDEMRLLLRVPNCSRSIVDLDAIVEYIEQWWEDEPDFKPIPLCSWDKPECPQEEDEDDEEEESEEVCDENDEIEEYFGCQEAPAEQSQDGDEDVEQ